MSHRPLLHGGPRVQADRPWRAPMPAPGEGQGRSGELQGNGEDRDERRQVARDERRGADEPHQQTVDTSTRADHEAAPASRLRSLSSRRRRRRETTQATADILKQTSMARIQGQESHSAAITFPFPTIQVSRGQTITSNDRRTSTLVPIDPGPSRQTDAEAVHELLPGRGQEYRESQERDHDRARSSQDFDDLHDPIGDHQPGARQGEGERNGHEDQQPSDQRAPDRRLQLGGDERGARQRPRRRERQAGRIAPIPTRQACRRSRETGQEGRGEQHGQEGEFDEHRRLVARE